MTSSRCCGPGSGWSSSRPYARVIAALLTEVHTDPEFAAEYHRALVEPRRDQARAVFRRAIERGEIPASTNIEVAVDLIYGPLWHRLLHGHAPLNDRFTQDVVDMALNGIQQANAVLPGQPGAPGTRSRKAAERRPRSQWNTAARRGPALPLPHAPLLPRA